MHGTSDLAATRPTKNSTSISDCPESFARWYCLNGATCFSVKIRDSTLYNCWCPMGFHGLRCDYKYVERRYHQTSSSKPAFTFTVALGNNQDKHDNLANVQHQTKELSLMIVYNIIVVLLIFLIIALFMRTLKKRGLIIKTIAQVNEENASVPASNVEQINQDCVSIGFGPNLLKQEQSHHHHQHYRSRAELQNQELLQQQQLQELKLHLHEQQQQQQQWQQTNQTQWMTSMGFTTDHQRRREPV